MNALTRFFVIGMQDADRRVAAALTPPSNDPADRYIRQSAIVRTIDAVTVRLHDAWTASTAGRSARDLVTAFASRDRTARYRTIALIVLVSVLTHVVLTLAQGPRPGWFWLVLPALASAFAVIVLMASRSTHSESDDRRSA